MNGETFFDAKPEPPQHYCAWCGTRRERPAKAGRWRCDHCRKANEVELGERTAQRCASCGEFYLISAHYCPACGKVSAQSPPSPLQSEHDLLPSPLQPIWPLKPWWEEDGRGLEAPPCPQCGGKLRPDGAGEHRYPGCARPPWNAGRDGKCAACGHQIAIEIEQQTHFTTKRLVEVVPQESFHQTFYDEGVVFSGVRIRVSETVYGPETPRVSELFLSMGELMALTRALEDSAKSLQAQMDWMCDWT